MTNYNIHIYREIRLVFRDIKAETPEAAAAIARDRPTTRRTRSTTARRTFPPWSMSLVMSL